MFVHVHGVACMSIPTVGREEEGAGGILHGASLLRRTLEPLTEEAYASGTIFRTHHETVTTQTLGAKACWFCADEGHVCTQIHVWAHSQSRIMHEKFPYHAEALAPSAFSPSCMYRPFRIDDKTGQPIRAPL